MDSATHILIGSAIGQVMAGKKYGNKALLWGAIAGSMPDADVLFQVLFSPVNSLFFHRGVSHSLLVWAIAAPLLAWGINRIYKGNRTDYLSWLKLTLVAWASHIFIDLFNTYGTGIFEPFSHLRVEFDSINVMDPFFSFPLLAAFVLYFIFKSVKFRTVAATAALVLSTGYFGFTLVNKNSVEKLAVRSLAEQDISYKRILSSPLPLSNFAWTIIAEDSAGYWTGIYYNVAKNDINFENILKEYDLAKPFEGMKDFKRLQTFTKGWYILRPNIDKHSGETISLYDLRFSAITSTATKSEPFAFRFDMRREGDKIKVGRTRPKRRVNFMNTRNYYKKLFKRAEA